MTLLQQTLERIERDASNETKSALRFAELIGECERITQRLNDAAGDGDKPFHPIVTTYSHVEGVCVRAYVYHGNLDRVRAAIADAGLTITNVFIGQTSTIVAIDGTQVTVEMPSTIEAPLKAAA